MCWFKKWSVSIILIAVCSACLVGCATKTEEIESFESFFARFNTDKDFQRAHIKFPLKYTYLDMDLIGTDRENEATKTGYKSKDEWTFGRFGVPKPNITVAVEVDESGQKARVRRAGKESGILIYYHFELIDSEWYLVLLDDQST